ncbi:MAG: cation-translocating P-type ATPase [Melioribacteraceae bacterium]|nr:cation-translocating P-type ATPase [Melioribacteraceae bacterium]MCF8265924.1 cation-translocating P-type ATPase [Melioribacteraceae bacterium]MCF8432410.1 cation-translocating P-type ATPase [Melioribacteraceae bacterium]
MPSSKIVTSDSKPEKEVLWFKKSITDTLKLNNTTSDGLSAQEATNRLEKYGENRIELEEKTSPWKLLWEQFSSLLIVILIVAAIISASIGQAVEAIAIIIIVILAGFLGFIQEFQAGKAIDSLRKMAAPHATVLRNGIESIVFAHEVVPGDIVLLATGDKIPADCRLLEAKNLRIDEAALTGESLAVEKVDTTLEQDELALGDRINMLYMGTSVTYGRGKAIVVGTGLNTEFGNIAKLLSTTESRKTPLQENLDQLGKKIGVFSIALAAIMSIIGIFRGYEIIEMFVWGVAVAVAVIPEALPAVVTISIALGVRRMVKRKALIRKLPAVETLGATSIICSDKTGTLTQDQMTIRKIFTGNTEYDVEGSGYTPEGNITADGKIVEIDKHTELEKLLIAGNLCNDTILKKEDGKWVIIGDPTEGAIVVAAAKAKLVVDEQRQIYPRLKEIPFSSESKRMTTAHDIGDEHYAFSKGAVEVILDSSSTILLNGNVEELTQEMRDKILENATRFGEDALRVLAVSQKKLNSLDELDENHQDGMTFIGIVGMIDPPRPEVKQAINTCFAAGIKPIMITGDHKITAVAVAKELGIKKDGGVVIGTEIEKMTDEEIENVVDHTDVFARISPGHKLKIVSALMKKGKIVAMTGDGVNDAPSLKKADIGVAMGIKGTDVSREAADMILTDDNFASIVSAVEEGRNIFENIRKYLVYLLSGNLGTVFALVVALFASLPLPLEAVQILFINFIMDGLMAIALGVEPGEDGVMNNKPRTVKEGILNSYSLGFIFFVGVLIGAVTLGIFYAVLPENVVADSIEEKRAVTIFFATLIVARLWNALNCRSLKGVSIRLNPFSNKALFVSTLFSLAMTWIVIYVDIFNVPFHTIPLAASDWWLILGYSSLVYIVVELWKLAKNTFMKTEGSAA